MKFKSGQLWIGLMCVILGIVISLQFKIVQKNYLEGQSPSVVSSQLVSELSKLRSEKASLGSEIDSLQKKIDDIENNAAEENAVIKTMKDELDSYKMLSGLVDVQGEGVEVVVDNPSKELSFSNELNILNEYDLIMRIVNELHAGGAEAVSINDQRIVATSEIRTAGNNLNVNGVPLSAPIVIKSIGDMKSLEGALNQRFGIVNELRETGYSIEVKGNSSVSIVKYNGDIKFEFAQIKK